MHIAIVFLSGNMCDPQLQRDMGIPFEFLSFAIYRGHMFYNHKTCDSFMMRSKRGTDDVVYGGLFFLRDEDFYLRSLDSYQLCSMSMLKRNHALDAKHRVFSHVTPISFDTVDELQRLLYVEREDVQAILYVGNPNHPTVKRLSRSRSRARLVQGVHVEPFVNLLQEVTV